MGANEYTLTYRVLIKKYYSMYYYYIVFKIRLEQFYSTVFGTTRKFRIPNMLFILGKI